MEGALEQVRALFISGTDRWKLRHLHRPASSEPTALKSHMFRLNLLHARSSLGPIPWPKNMRSAQAEMFLGHPTAPFY